MAKGTLLCIKGVKAWFGHNTTVDVFRAEMPEPNRDRKEYLEQTFYIINLKKVAVQFINSGSSQSTGYLPQNPS
jgi:hypothetical protein